MKEPFDQPEQEEELFGCDCCGEEDVLEEYEIKNNYGMYCEHCISQWDNYVNGKIAEGKEG